MTKVPVIHVDEGKGLKLWCEWCDITSKPKREFLSDWREFRYESAKCPECGKEIAGLVVKRKSNRKPEEEKRGVGPDG